MTPPKTKLAAARRAAGLSMEDLARRAGVTTPTVYRLEHRKRVGSAESWKKLARALGTTPEKIRGPL